MTRIFRPPTPILVRCTDDGQPAWVIARGQHRCVTAATRTWVQHSLYGPTEGAGGDRLYYRVILDGLIPWDIYQESADGCWYLQRIHN